MLRGTIYLGVSSPLLRGQHQYPKIQTPTTKTSNTQTSITDAPNAQTPLSDNQCPDSDFSGILCFFHRVMLWKEHKLWRDGYHF